MDSLRRIRSWVNQAFSTKYGKYILITIFSISLMTIGGFIHSLVTTSGEGNVWEKVGVFVSGMFAFLVASVVFIERIFRIESEEKKIQLSAAQLKKESIDEEEFSYRLTNRIINVLNREVGNIDKTFEERSKHYGTEKEQLSEDFIFMLQERVSYLRHQGISNIQIIFDSGTTIAPIFRTMAYCSSQNKKYWARSVDVITNNLKGIQLTLGYRENDNTGGMQNPDNDRYRDIPLKCTILPGQILSAYEGIADEHTLKAIRALYVKRRRERYYTISVTTGNYVLFNKGVLLPVARTGYHPHVKYALYSTSNEVYVAAPLGKLLTNNRADSIEEMIYELNNDLKFDDKSELECEKSYTLVNSKKLEMGKHKYLTPDLEEWMKKSILITTERDQGRDILYPHYQSIQASLKEFNPKEVTLCGPSIWSSKFVDVPFRRKEQLDVAVPHESLRPFVEKYLDISPQIVTWPNKANTADRYRAG